jgi:DNA-binding response OmpR family regulator
MIPIILLEDEIEGAEILKDFLAHHGYQVWHAPDGPTAQSMLTQSVQPFQLAILDVMVPEPDGYALLAQIRAQSHTAHMPVIMLTARDRDSDEITGLNQGADDYIRKPASLSLILAHIQTLLRRANVNPAINTATPAVEANERLVLDQTAKQAFLLGQALNLTWSEFQLLALMFAHPHRIFTRQELVDALHDSEPKTVYDRTIDAHIKNLRLKLQDHAAAIRTCRGIGYCFDADYVVNGEE